MPASAVHAPPKREKSSTLINNSNRKTRPSVRYRYRSIPHERVYRSRGLEGVFVVLGCAVFVFILINSLFLLYCFSFCCIVCCLSMSHLPGGTTLVFSFFLCCFRFLSFNSSGLLACVCHVCRIQYDDTRHCIVHSTSLQCT